MNQAIIQYIDQLRLSGIKELYRTQNTPAEKQELLNRNYEAYKNCKNCPLYKGRKHFVYGEGNPDAVCMVIGEGPGEQENLQGRPFVGPAGQLLDKMLLAIKIKREDVYITNIVKCRPPGNRNPLPEERLACLPYLEEQIKIIEPEIFLFMGLVAAQTLLESSSPMHDLRSVPHEFMDRPAYVTYHPAALLRNPQWKKDAWQDLQKFQAEYDALISK
ncbi:MAG TPA: uracil-DNA glycosylase [Candidatus Cloacimonadota bacterium]|nr:uracil-DNA glycosylase [Candidatus Cloacimonadota bacterium]HQL14759.1 uracil-DNA glycosylase [Candidatus Cloacimonadota bacterium]